MVVAKKLKLTEIKEEDFQMSVMNITEDEVSCPYLPQELVIDNILTRLSIKHLCRLSCVCKSWYHSIFVDNAKFSISHFARHRDKKILVFNLLNVYLEDDYEEDDDSDLMLRNYIFSVPHERENSYDFKQLATLSVGGWIEPIGNCNGLVCLKRLIYPKEIFIINPWTSETLVLTYSVPEIKGGGSLEYFCHGFGFDSSSQVYKVVLIYKALTKDGVGGFICKVTTLGGSSWRETVTSTHDLSPPPDFPSTKVITRISMPEGDTDDRMSSTICGDDLLWSIYIEIPDYDNIKRIHMLLSFDIQNEKIQFIRLPNECTSYMSVDLSRGDILVRHLLEFKGYPCVACSQEIWVEGRINEYKVHMYILKDKVRQIWTKDESFHVRFMEEFMEDGEEPLDPFTMFFYQDYDKDLGRDDPTRISSFADQAMLYWFDGGCLIFYNLRMNHYNVVQGNSSCDEQVCHIFKSKISATYEHDTLECPYNDYQLHWQAENIISLKTFIPKEVNVVEFECFEKFQQFVRGKELVGWMENGRKSRKWYAFV